MVLKEFDPQHDFEIDKKKSICLEHICKITTNSVICIYCPFIVESSNDYKRTKLGGKQSSLKLLNRIQIRVLKTT